MHRAAGGRAGQRTQCGANHEGGLRQIGGQLGLHGDVLDVRPGRRVEIDVAVDARLPPVVLVFEPACIRVARVDTGQLVG